MSKITKQGLINLIAKEISYDAHERKSQIKCPHCKKIARKQELSYWIDHKSTLASQIGSYLKMPTTKHDEYIYDILSDNDYMVDGNPKKDAEMLADIFIEELGIKL